MQSRGISPYNPLVRFQVHRVGASTLISHLTTHFWFSVKCRGDEAEKYSRFTGTWVLQGYRVSTGDEAEKLPSSPDNCGVIGRCGTVGSARDPLQGS
jgi:hypothetical protein